MLASNPKQKTPKSKPEVTPPKCAHCGCEAALVDGDLVYPHRPDLYHKKFWRCWCGSYVGCHPGTSIPLGTPAGARLRRLRADVHAAFDPLWRKKMLRDGLSKKKARGAGYAWLASKVGTDPEATHIGQFSIDQCKAALAALRGNSEE